MPYRHRPRQTRCNRRYCLSPLDLAGYLALTFFFYIGLLAYLVS